MRGLQVCQKLGMHWSNNGISADLEENSRSKIVKIGPFVGADLISVILCQALCVTSRTNRTSQRLTLVYKWRRRLMFILGQPLEFFSHPLSQHVGCLWAKPAQKMFWGVEAAARTIHRIVSTNLRKHEGHPDNMTKVRARLHKGKKTICIIYYESKATIYKSHSAQLTSPHMQRCLVFFPQLLYT